MPHRTSARHRHGRAAPSSAPPRRAPSAAATALLAAVLLAGCGIGTGTLRISEAEREVVAVAAELVEATGMTVEGPVEAAPLEQCELRSGRPGLRTRVAVRGALPDDEGALADAFDAAGRVLVARDLVLVDSGVADTLLGQRDGITVTVASIGTDLQVDALTGCRPR